MNSNLKMLSRNLRGGIAVVAGVALFGVAPAIAQQNPGAQSPAVPSEQRTPGAPGTGDTMTSQTSDQQTMDKRFVHTALQGGMAEVQLGQLAVQKGSSEDVKQFGQKMVDDHTKLGDQMKQVAEQMNVKVPDSPSKKDQKTMAKLQALNGDAFDKAYIKDMVKDHENDEREFKHEAATASNPALKEAATQGEQVISEHLQMIKQIAQKDNVAAK